MKQKILSTVKQKQLRRGGVSIQVGCISFNKQTLLDL